MATVLPKINYLTKDYESFRADLIAMIPAFLPEWTDLSENDPGIALLELESFAMDILSYYQDRKASEATLVTATQRQSVINACAGIGYRLKTTIPSRTTQAQFTITPQASDYLIRKGYQFGTKATPTQPSIIFETEADLVIPAGKVGNEVDGSGRPLYVVAATQGLTLSNEILGSSTGQPSQKFTLKNPNVIIDDPVNGSSLIISVNSGSGFENWTDVTNSVTPFVDSGKQYTWTINESGYLTVRFGDGSSGAIPPIGTNSVKATYRIGGGQNTNTGVNTLTVPITTASVIRTVTNLTAAIGGLDQESMAHAKSQAPLSLRTSNRAVTGSDYEVLAKSLAGVQYAKAVTKSGFSNMVFLSIAPVGGGNPTQTLMDTVYAYLNDLKTITTTITMQNPKYLPVRGTINVKVDPNASNSQIQTLVQQMVTNLLGVGADDFGQGEYLSSLYQQLNQVSGVLYLSIDRFTVKPRIDAFQSTGNPTWGTVAVNTGHTYDGFWKVQMTSATAFTVSYNPSGDGTTWVQDGTGTFGAAYNSGAVGTKITFTITAGGVAAATGDNWQFRTTAYVGNIIPASDEILLLDTDFIITPTGGVA